MAIACGVDFGTSNSTVGWIGQDSPAPGSALLALEDGKATLPSVVFFNAEDEEVSYGRAALAGYLAGAAAACKYPGAVFVVLPVGVWLAIVHWPTEHWRIWKPLGAFVRWFTASKSTSAGRRRG